MLEGGKTEGMETEGLANVPPIAGPMIVPMDHTNGITAYARARVDQSAWIDSVRYVEIEVSYAHAPSS